MGKITRPLQAISRGAGRYKGGAKSNSDQNENRKHKNPTIRAAIIGFWATIIAALITAFTALVPIIFANIEDSEENAIEYAYELVNQSSTQDLSGRESTVDKLKQLADEHPDNEKFDACYAKGLVNLSEKQDLSGRESTVAILEQLADEHPVNEEIAACYAGGLFYLSVVQIMSGIESESTVDILEQLMDEHPVNEEIAAWYAKSLDRLSRVQDLSGVEDTVATLEHLEYEYPGNTDICTCHNSVQIILELKKAQS